MGTKISKQTRRELLEALRERYGSVSKIEKSKILDEFIDIAGCHRKHAIRLLTGVNPVMSDTPKPGRRIYSEAVREALVILWEAADRICGKRLKAILPGLISALERHGHLAPDPTDRHLLLAASPATIDRLLTPIRGTAGRRRKQKRTTKPSREIPVRTFADWSEPEPGFLEVDFVAHGGDSMQGTFLWSLVATDVCSGWSEAVPLVAREQSLVVEGLEVIRRQLPVPICGIIQIMIAPSSMRFFGAIASNRRSSSHARGPTRRMTRLGSSRRMAPSSAGSWAINASRAWSPASAWLAFTA